MAADSYSSDYGDYGMPDASNGGPTGIPDPNNPGYDTAGYPLSGATQAPQTTFTNTAPGATPITMGGQTPVGATAGTPAGTGSWLFADKAPATDPAPAQGGLLDAFQGAAPSFVGANVGQAPVFTPPAFTPPPAFKDPTAAEAAAEPGYDFALKQGLGSVEAAAAAKGVLNTGGTLKDIFDYGSHAATQNYQNVDNRARNNYLLNYQTQYTDPYQFAYRGAADAFAPKMAQYAAENNVNLANASGANTFDFNTWLQQYNMFRNRQLDTINANAATA